MKVYLTTWGTVLCWSAILFCLQPSLALAVHIHCDEIDWSAANIGTIPAVPADYRPGGNSSSLGFFSFTFNLPAAPKSNVPLCEYEISDITKLTMIFTLVDGPMSWQTLQVGLVSGGPGMTLPGLTDFGGIGSGTEIRTFPPHQTLGAFELDLSAPFPNFPTTLKVRVAPRDEFMITAASATLEGHHYYTPVPEPSTYLLFCTGILVILGYGWRRKGSKS